MAKAELKTKVNNQSPEEFLAKVSPAVKREDCLRILQLVQQVTGEKPKRWGSSIIGFGTYQYKYPSGREGEWFVAGFSPRKQNITLYIMAGLAQHGKILARLGKHKTGKCCLYINGTGDIELPVLKELIEQSVPACRKRNR